MEGKSTSQEGRDHVYDQEGDSLWSIANEMGVNIGASAAGIISIRIRNSCRVIIKSPDQYPPEPGNGFQKKEGKRSSIP
jgi:hypothetical protein